jgi:hypothetical protein
MEEDALITLNTGVREIVDMLQTLGVDPLTPIGSCILIVESDDGVMVLPNIDGATDEADAKKITVNVLNDAVNNLTMIERVGE